MLAEEVLVEDELAVDLFGGGAQDAEDGVGEDCGLAEVLFLAGVFLCELLGGCGFDCLSSVSKMLILHMVYISVYVYILLWRFCIGVCYLPRRARCL